MLSTPFNIALKRTEKSRISEIDFNNLPFGKTFSDHMLIADYENGAWKNPEIVPFGKIPMSPSISALHYGQAIFEGLKAYAAEDGRIGVFRPKENHKRMNLSAERMAMPAIPEDIFIEGMKQLIEVDKAWTPKSEQSSLYLRPVMFATDEAVGVKPSENYRFVIFTCPVGPYFLEPVKVYAETNYARSFEGGPGFAKAAGNYGGAFHPTRLAQQKGYHQVIWLDSIEHQYVEESGAMNLMAVINGKVVTPALSSSKLAGITRKSIIEIAKDWGITVEERNLSIHELIDAHQKGLLEEMFGCGTAAQIAPIALLGYQDKQYPMPERNDNLFSVKVGKELNNIKYSKIADTRGWMEYI